MTECDRDHIFLSRYSFSFSSSLSLFFPREAGAPRFAGKAGFLSVSPPSRRAFQRSQAGVAKFRPTTTKADNEQSVVFRRADVPPIHGSFISRIAVSNILDK